MNRLLPSFLASLLALFLTQCATPPPAGEEDASTIAVGTFKDDRGVPPSYIGQIRGAAQTPVLKVETSIPVSQIVENAFGHTLAQRKMLAQPMKGQWLLQGAIREFSCDQFAKIGSTAEITISLTKSGEASPAFRKSYTAEDAMESLPGAESNPQLIKDLAAKTLQQLVDNALDDPELRQLLDARL